METERISPTQANERVKAGKALLVCAYEKEEKCNKMRLEGSMLMDEFKQKSASLPKDQDIIFYCT